MRLSTIGLILVLGLLTAPPAANAQQRGSVPRIGVLLPGSPEPEYERRLDAFRQGLRELGYIDTQNILLEYRWAYARYEHMADLVAEAGFPPGVINVVTGNGHTAGDRLVKHPDVDKVAFTGSTEVGKIINRNATETLKRVTLELGGKSPVIVMPDVNVDEVAPAAAGGVFFNSGQICVAGSRLFAHRSIFDRMVEGVAKASAFWRPRPSLDPEGHMGPLVSKEQMDRVMGYIEKGKREGASVAVGGNAAAANGYYVNPTVLVDVKPSMSVVREEIFGPVLVAQRFDTLDEVAKAANDTSYGLAAGIWTRDVSTMHKLAAKLKAGTVWGNCHAVIDPALPFGGFKQSGIGREQGREGIEAYTEIKTVIIQL